ncbi:zinc finger, CCHC-type containing protein [Tanacetum coccineum]
MKVDRIVQKFKAKLVIQGFRQNSGIDYFNTYAPMARISTIRLLVALTSIHNLIIHHMDVKTTFLNGELDEEIYMNQPQGFIMPGNENKEQFLSFTKAKHAINQFKQMDYDMCLSLRLCDSVATLEKAYSHMYNGKSKHLGVRHSMILELIMNGVGLKSTLSTMKCKTPNSFLRKLESRVQCEKLNVQWTEAHVFTYHPKDVIGTC